MFLFMNNNDFLQIIKIVNNKNISYDEAENIYLNTIHQKIYQSILTTNMFENFDKLEKIYNNTNRKIEKAGYLDYLSDFIQMNKFEQLTTFNNLLLSSLYISLCEYSPLYENVISKYEIPTKEVNSTNIYTILATIQTSNYNSAELESLYISKTFTEAEQCGEITDEISEKITMLGMFEEYKDMFIDFDDIDNIDNKCLSRMVYDLKYNEASMQDITQRIHQILGAEEECYEDEQDNHYTNSNLLHYVKFSKKIIEKTNNYIGMLELNLNNDAIEDMKYSQNIHYTIYDNIEKEIDKYYDWELDSNKII